MTNRQDIGNMIPTCRYCEAHVSVPRGVHDTEPPAGVQVEDWHASAACVEGVEPSQKMGGPA